MAGCLGIGLKCLQINPKCESYVCNVPLILFVLMLKKYCFKKKPEATSCDLCECVCVCTALAFRELLQDWIPVEEAVTLLQVGARGQKY